VHHQLLPGLGDLPLQPVDVAVDLVVELGVQVELQRGHPALLGHPAVDVADADVAQAQALRQHHRHGGLAAAKITVDHYRLLCGHAYLLVQAPEPSVIGARRTPPTRGAPTDPVSPGSVASATTAGVRRPGRWPG